MLRPHRASSRPPLGLAIVPPTAAPTAPAHTMIRTPFSAPSDLSSIPNPPNANQLPDSPRDADTTLPFIDASFLVAAGAQSTKPAAQRPPPTPPLSADCSPFRAPLARCDTDTTCPDASTDDELENLNFYRIPDEDFQASNGNMELLRAVDPQMVALGEYLRAPENAARDGLFRKSGSCVRQRDILAHLETGRELSELSSSELTPEDAACVFKQCLRELPESLLTSELEVSFLECAAQSAEDRSLDEAVERLCGQLPAEQLAHVAYAMCVLQRVHEAQTQRQRDPSFGEATSSRAMDAHNLALVLAPNIFHCTRAVFEEQSGRPSEKKKGRSASLTRSPSFLAPSRDWRARRGRSSSQQVSGPLLPPNRLRAESNTDLKRLLEQFPPPARQSDSHLSTHKSLGSLKAGPSHSRLKSITKSSEDTVAQPPGALNPTQEHLLALETRVVARLIQLGHRLKLLALSALRQPAAAAKTESAEPKLLDEFFVQKKNSRGSPLRGLMGAIARISPIKSTPQSASPTAARRDQSPSLLSTSNERLAPNSPLACANLTNTHTPQIKKRRKAQAVGVTSPPAAITKKRNRLPFAGLPSLPAFFAKLGASSRAAVGEQRCGAAPAVSC